MDNPADVFVELKERAARYKDDYDACSRRFNSRMKGAKLFLIPLSILVLLTMLPAPYPVDTGILLGLTIFIGCIGILFILSAQSEMSNQKALSREWDSWLDSKQFSLFERCFDCQQRLVQLVAMESDKQLIGQTLRNAEIAKHVYDTFKRVAVNLKLSPKAKIPDNEADIVEELS